jgi:hypothetical protein
MAKQNPQQKRENEQRNQHPHQRAEPTFAP